MSRAGGHQPLTLGILVSGQGTNLQAILDAIGRGELPARVALVASNNPEAPALVRAAQRGVPTFVVSRRDYPERAARQRAIEERLLAAEVELVVLAGFNEILLPELVQRFRGRIINTHPSLLPAFGGGMHAVRDALRHGVKVSGCTVHFVTEEVDAGPIIAQRCVPVFDGDTEETLHQRIREQEHQVLPEVIRWFAEGRLRVEGRRVLVETPERGLGR